VRPITAAVRWALALPLIGLPVALSGAATLPVPCIAGSCGPSAPANWVSSGAATAVQKGNTLTVNQSSSQAVLNWRTFNISKDGTVTFKQPKSTSIALNEIFQSDPSKILGALSANGEIYLINQNGIVFGAGAQVNTASLIASTLNITPAAAGGILQAIQTGQPAFAQQTDANGNPLPTGNVQVQAGATLKSSGGEVLLLAPQVTNAGTVSADGGGQVILAAGNSVYLAGSTDPNLRGLVVAVGTQGGTATNRPGGVISASNGNVSMVGLFVNQLGRVSATTSVRENGSVFLLAQDGAQPVQSGSGFSLATTNNGTLTVGPGSQTDVSLDLNDPATTVDATPQARSVVTLAGQAVTLESGSTISATSGAVSITAASLPTAGAGRLVIDSGATIDVSGANIELPMSSNVIPVQLRGTELANSPLQRNTPIYGQTVYIDIRQSGTFDGTPWVGSPIGDLSGYVAAVPRTVGQRSLTGGTITLNSDGAVFVSPHATLNVSGGTAAYQSGYVNTTQLLGTNGVVYDISQAVPTQTYSTVVNGYTFTDPKWGQTITYTQGPGRYEAGYTQGYDAGSVNIVAPAVVLDGSIVATTVAGPNQRQLPGPIPEGALYRADNQIPLGGQLVLGLTNGTGGDFIAPNITFEPGLVLDQLTGPGGAPFDPLTSPLPASLDTIRLRPDLFGTGRVTNLEVSANGAIDLPADVSLVLPAAGSIAMQGGAIDIAGRITAPSGLVSADVQPTITYLPGAANAGLTLAPTAAINVAGGWVNDLPLGATTPGTAVLSTTGGSVSLSTAPSGSELDLARGSLINVSGGGQRTSGGTIVPGAGGSISLNAGLPVTATGVVPLIVDSKLEGFALSRGGSFSLSANTVCIAASNCTGGDPSTFWASPALFSKDGFSQVSLASKMGGLTVEPGTAINAQQLNYFMTGSGVQFPTGTPLAQFAPATLVPEPLRLPVSVSLAANISLPGGQPFTAAEFAQAPDLSVGHNASISVDPGGALKLTSNGSIVVDGTLSAPAGSLTVATTVGLPILEFLPNQGIWLLSDAQLLARGAAQVLPNTLGQPTGTVLAGGTIDVAANRGYLIMNPGSMIDASGTATTLYLPSSNLTQTAPTLVASSGGTITLAGSEGLQLSGALQAHAGAAQGAAGGTLNVTLDGNLHGPEPFEGAPIFPLSPRQIVISDSAPVVFAPNSSIPLGLNGIGRLPLTTVEDGGFDSAQLTATDLVDPLAPNIPLGSIYFPQSISLKMPTSLRLDTPQLVAAAGAVVSLSAPYVGLGYVDETAGTQAPITPTAGTGTLHVSAGLVDLFGGLALDGFASSRIASTGDIRAIGVQTESTGSEPTQPISGQLEASGSLTLQAAQVYPTTLTEYSIDVSGPNGLLTILPGGTPVTPLSAGGMLTLSANSINQAGTLQAPFGRLVLSGNNVTLAAGSVTSTSGAGETIPFGSTQAGVDWVYPLPLGQTVVYTSTGPPSKSIQLQGTQITVAKGATVNISGGGDLQAVEFVPGVGGTIDVLSTAVNPQEFAILPMSGLASAPYDWQTSAGFPYAVGTTVTLSAGSGVPAGTYAVLPPRYALLNGGYLVTPVKGYTDLLAGQAVPQPGGGTVVAGEFGAVGVGVTQSRTSGFDVLPSSGIQQLGQYSLTSATTFFNAQATANKVPAPQLPPDAGQLQLLAGSALQFLGRLADVPASGGRGSEVDISASNIEITTGAATAAPPGVVTLSQGQLNGLGAESVLIGGLRTSYSGAVPVDTTATTLTVDPGVSLSFPDLLLVAADQVIVGAGATLKASGASTVAPATEFDLTGGGAFLRLSTGMPAPVVRTNLDQSAGDLTIANGATLAATGSALLESTGNLRSGAQYKLSGASLEFDASQITLGTPTAAGAQPGLILNPSALSPLGLAALTLNSSSTLGIAGSNSLKLPGNATLEAAAIDALTADASLSVKAGSLTLIGGSASAPAAPSSSAGSVTLDAQSIYLGGGTLSLSGFKSSTLEASGQIQGIANTTLSADHQLTLAAARVDVSNGITLAISSTDQLALMDPANESKPSTAPGTGGALTLTGSQVTIDTAVTLPSGGLLTVAATGAGSGQGVVIGSKANLNLAGTTEVFDGLTVDGGGGRIEISTAAGNVSVAAGAKLNVSGAGTSGSGGEIGISTPSGTATVDGALIGSSGADAAGARFSLVSTQLPDLVALNAALNGGGFTGARSFQQTGSGDLLIGAGANIHAGHVTISNDGGAIDLLGSINASGANAGSVLLAAATGIDVAGSIDVHGGSGSSTAGLVQLDTVAGAIDLAPSSTVNLGSAGVLDFRVPRTSLIDASGAVAPQIALQGTIVGGSTLQVEGFTAYTATGGVISATDTLADPSNPIFADATNFMANAPAIAAALNAPAKLKVAVVPGVEIDSASDLTLPAAWDLSAWRFGGAPGVLTLRAAGNLNIDASLSDGFAGATAVTLPTSPDQSWSYRLVAGAALGASDPLSVATGLPATTGNVVIGPGFPDVGQTPPQLVMVRTGTGSIDVAAANDLQFGNQASVMYTAGVASATGIPLPLLNGLAYPTGGGNINVRVGGDVVGAATNQLVTSWLWRTGQPVTAPNASATGWTVNYQWFEENIGALGGGDVSIEAGGNIRELSVAIPSIGVQVGGASAAQNDVLATGGGQLNVESGGSIFGGSYYVGRGAATLTAWNTFGADTSGEPGATGLAPILAVGDAGLNVFARSGVQIETAVNPTLLPQANSQPVVTRTQSTFSTYTDQSAVNLLADAGDVVIVNDTGSVAGQLTSMSFTSQVNQSTLFFYPSSVQAIALGGNVNLGGTNLSLWPSPRGNLNLLASAGVQFNPLLNFLMDDVTSPVGLPTPASPAAGGPGPRGWGTAAAALLAPPAPGVSYIPIHSAAYSGSEDPNPIRIVALNGDVSDANLVFLAKQTQIVAGGDITGLALRNENLSDNDETVVAAGGNLVYPFPRGPTGVLQPDPEHGIEVEGPGSLLVTTGKQFNLGTSSGIKTVGNLFNAENAPLGAAVTVLAGATPATADLSGFTQTYLVSSDAYDAQLEAYVSARTGTPVTSKSAALAAFAQFTPDEQFALCQQIMLSEVRLGGEAAANPASPDYKNYTRSFNAIDSLFPGSTSSSASDVASRYPGDISLYFSQIYTLDGGSVTLLAPGGFVNVGISTPPLAFGLTKQPSDLGIVAEGVGNISSVSYGDFQVNQSRVFAADGGDILVWSTDGNIDAGRGAKTAISAPPPTVQFNSQGQIETVFPAALQGSGIQALAVSADVTPGNVDLFAPRGVVNANDAGIVAGNITIGATAVLGRDNITFSGVAVGLPVEVTGVGASVASSSAAASATANTAAAAVESNASQQQAATSVAESAVSWLDVFLIGLGEENCKPDDVECLKRQKAK
jgi:filamentous hemagglutinin family protein